MQLARDLVQIDGAGRTHLEAATNKESYYAWNEDVVSVGRGRVVAVVNDHCDLEIGEAPSPTQNPAGNHVVVQYGRRLFGVYAHMQQGSATVSVGDWVKQGQILGLVGNSGNTTEPHLHVHFADRWAGSEEPVLDIYFSQGVPAIFWGGQIVRGDQVFPLNGTTPLEHDAIVP